MADNDDPQGIQFTPTDGRTSTSATGQRIFAAAVRSLDGRLANTIEKEPNWRKNYGRHLVDLVSLAVERGDKTHALVDAGLDALQPNFSFVRDGEKLAPRQAMRQFQDDLYRSGTVDGMEPTLGRLEIPYRGERLAGDRLQ